MLRLNDPPERIAKGAALGVVCGILPTFGFGGVIAFALAFVFRANKAASILGSLIMNPITTPFFWSFSIILGSVILGEEYSGMLEKIKTDGLAAGFTHVYIVFLLGNSIIASTLAFVTYKIVKNGIYAHRRHVEEKKRRKRELNSRA